MAVILETPRLQLRRMTEADADHLVALNRNTNVMRYILTEPPVTTREEALVALRDRIFPQYALAGTCGRWACIDKGTGAFLGWCGVKYIEADGEYDIGYRFLEEHWGKGFATEAAAGVCELARRHLAGKRVVAKAMRGNAASRRVLEKIGMTFEGMADDGGVEVAVYVLAT
jgi:ribosomal-protein-alanine N-acetyltransferase